MWNKALVIRLVPFYEVNLVDPVLANIVGRYEDLIVSHITFVNRTAV